MGICFSKRKMPNGPSPTRVPSSQPAPPEPPLPGHLPEKETATTPPLTQHQSQTAVALAKKQIFVTTSSSNNNNEHKDQIGGPAAEALPAAIATAAAAAAEKMKSSTAIAGAAATSVKQAAIHRSGAAAPEEDPPQVATTVRTSSCSKEEVESILIQCGRLSRNSSGTEARHHHRSRKRSYDFDCGEREFDEEDEEREKPSSFGSRPSPHRHRHRRTPSREGDNSEHNKRSGSRERAGGSCSSGGRRMSRSPGKRSDTLVVSSSSHASSAADKPRQPPGKMVSVPAREKTSAAPSEVNCGMSTVRKSAPSSVAAADGGIKRGSEVGGMRSASPRSRSPANPPTSRSCSENAHPQHLPQQPQSLSRSSSRKAEHSPYRRNPMAEVDGNIVLRVEQNDNKQQSSRKTDEGTRKPAQSHQPQVR